MSKQLDFESDFDRDFIDKKGRTIRLVLDEDAPTCYATHDGTEIGRMEFNYIEYERHNDLKLTWMYLTLAGDGYTGCGIGRQMIEMMAEFHGGPLVAGEHDAHQQEDGSHLTGTGPIFVERMRFYGFIRSVDPMEEM